MGNYTVAVVGGGQLARMMSQQATALGVRLRTLVESEDASTAQVVPDSVVGHARDEAAVRAICEGADVLTFEHEHVDDAQLARLVAEGMPVRPGPHALLYAQDKVEMRRRVAGLGVEVPQWAEVRSAADLAAFGERLGWPVIVKTPRGGYDGKGVRLVNSPDDVADWLADVAATGEAGAEGGHLLAEERVPFTRELAALVARRPSGGGGGSGGAGGGDAWNAGDGREPGDGREAGDGWEPGDGREAGDGWEAGGAWNAGGGGDGEVAVWPVVETVQDHGVCSEVIAPAPGLPDDVARHAQDMAVRIARGLDVTGVLAVELFAVEGPEGVRLSVNELAMRPHNSGHWTIEGAVTSQFEQHLRAVLDLPLGATAARQPWAVMVNLLGSGLADPRVAYPRMMELFPDVKVHLYGKDVRPRRKLGHVTVFGDDLGELRAKAHAAVALLRGDAVEGDALDTGGQVATDGQVDTDGPVEMDDRVETGEVR